MAGAGTLGHGSTDTAPTAAATLRVIDWRFLLPTPPTRRFRRLAMLGSPRGGVERAMLAGLADDVVATLRGMSTADAVVAYAAAGEAIPEIAAAVGPGGVLYLEVDRARRGVRATTPTRVANVLREAGLSICALYAMEPDVRDARAFVPLEPPEAMSWHRRTLFGEGAMLRVVNAVRRTAVRAGGATVAALDRPYAVIATRGDSGGSTPGVLRDPAVIDRLGSNQAPSSAVMLTYGGDRVLLFPFGDGSSEPVGVVKVPKTAALVERTEREQAQMRTLRTALDPSMADSIPEPLGLVHLAGTVAACEQFVPGASIAARAMHSARARTAKTEDLELAMAWLVRFHRATEIRRTTFGAAMDDLIRETIDSYRRDMAPRDEAPFIDRVRSALSSLGTASVTISMQHRDFAAWNVMRSDARIVVVDWEGACEGVGAFDAIHLATTWLYAVRLASGDDDETRCVLDLLAEDPRVDDAAHAARRALTGYFEALALDVRLTLPLIALHRLELAVRRAEQRRLHGDASDADVPSADVRVVRAMAREADRLFPSPAA